MGKNFRRRRAKWGIKKIDREGRGRLPRGGKVKGMTQRWRKMTRRSGKVMIEEEYHKGNRQVGSQKVL